MLNNHFEFLGETDDPEMIVTVRVQNIKEKQHHNCYMDMTVFSEDPYAIPFGEIVSLLQEQTNPDKISVKSERVYLDKETLEV